ncbi:membrane protein insertion efficiency factor YidD [Sodalis-like secondary symbiont of Drepanosiphum platanoidis]|uniref:membrane protein insertion efficiency factor YidD n=1 Tax=Sodalis-like secondary symbiont of Drepanosiphum platanoidis TaxID=2994493 RepID=UPI003463C8AF
MESILFLIKKIFIFFIKIYQIIISPFLKSRCIFNPTCSQYSIESINKFGIIKGLYLIFLRIIRCNRFFK